MEHKRSGLTIVGFVFSLLSFICVPLSFTPFAMSLIFPILGLLLSLLAIVFGGIGISRQDGGLAIAALVLGIIGFIGNLMMVFVLVFVIGLVFAITSPMRSSSLILIFLL